MVVLQKRLWLATAGRVLRWTSKGLQAARQGKGLLGARAEEETFLLSMACLPFPAQLPMKRGCGKPKILGKPVLSPSRFCTAHTQPTT